MTLSILERNNLGEFGWQFNTKEGPPTKKEDPWGLQAA
jgi:hypothetical protein